MAVWEKAKVLASGRVNVDVAGASWVRILSSKFRSNDGVDFCFIGFGCDIIFGGIET